MRIRLLVAAFLLLLGFVALPAADAQVGRKLYLPVIARDATPTPLPAQDVHIRYRAYVQDQTARQIRRRAGQELLSRSKALNPEPRRPKQARQGLPHRRVVIHDTDGGCGLWHERS